MAEDKKIEIELTVEAGGGFQVLVAPNTDFEQYYEVDSVAELGAKLTRVAENLHQFIPPEESVEGEGAVPGAKALETDDGDHAREESED